MKLKLAVALFMIAAISLGFFIGRFYARGSAQPGFSFAVSLPPLKLADREYIQSLEVTIEGGRIATINRTWDDWDMELDWDSPEDLALKCHARESTAQCFDLENTGSFSSFS